MDNHLWIKVVRGFSGGSRVKNPPANTGDTVQSLDQENPLEKEMATHPSILAWEIPWTEEPGGATVHGVTRAGPDLVTKLPPY